MSRKVLFFFIEEMALSLSIMESPNELLAAEVVVIVSYVVRQSHLHQFLKIAQEFARAVKSNEPGCVLYVVSALELQTSNRVYFTEAYSSMSAYECHQKSGELAAFRTDRREMIVSYQHQIYSPASNI